MSNILNTIKLVEAKRSPEPDYNDPSWDEKVQNIGQKAKQAELLKSKGKEPRTRWNPETKKYYVDFSDQVDEAEEPSALATTGSPLKFIKQSAGKLKPKYKMELINLLKISLKPKQAAVAETLGTPYPGTYEQTNDMFKSHGAKRTGTLTTEQSVAESDLDKYKKYTRPVVKTTPKIERTTNPSGRSTDHVEWIVTSDTGEKKRFTSKRLAQEYYNMCTKQSVAEGAPELLKAEMPMVRHIENELATKGYKKGTEEYKKMFGHALAYYRKFGFPDYRKGVAEGFPYDVDHMPGATVKNPNTSCTRCNGRGTLWKAPDGKILRANDVPGAQRYKCGACDGIGMAKKEVDEGENWSKHNNKRAGGMSKKSVASYRRSHPGSKIQTAVTTKPSKLKKGSKAAARRKSFCARMRGMKKHRTGAKTANDPNSNINKSLRRWHCESIEELHELVMLAEQYIRNNKK